jgi:hypothetical protein
MERERRLPLQTDRQDFLPILQPYAETAIKEIVLGEKMPIAYRERIAAIVNAKYPETPIRIASRCRDSYSLSIE